MNVKEHLDAVLMDSFINARVEVDQGPTGLCDALVISESFQGVPDEQRQEKIWRALKAKMNREELVQVSFVLASTPQEAESLLRHPSDED